MCIRDRDLIVFTGDLVNQQSHELDGFQEILSQLYAPDGVYSILGNHDYGSYYHLSLIHIFIDHCHSVPFHTVLFQQVDALHHLDERGLALLVLPVFVMELLRQMCIRDRHSRRHVVGLENIPLE